MNWSRQEYVVTVSQLTVMYSENLISDFTINETALLTFTLQNQQFRIPPLSQTSIRLFKSAQFQKFSETVKLTIFVVSQNFISHLKFQALTVSRRLQLESHFLMHSGLIPNSNELDKFEFSVKQKKKIFFLRKKSVSLIAYQFSTDNYTTEGINFLLRHCTFT